MTARPLKKYGRVRGTTAFEMDDTPVVRTFDVTGSQTSSVLAYHAGLTSGVRVATCDFDRDGRDELVTAAGLPDGGPHVRLFSRRPDDSVVQLAEWYAIDREYRGGVYVACGDVDGDAIPEVVTASGAEGPAVIQVWKPNLAAGVFRELGRGTVGDILSGGGVRVAACDLTSDGRAEILASAAGGGATSVHVFDLASGRTHFLQVAMAGEAAGLQLACGDFVPGGSTELLVGLDIGGSPIVRAFTSSGALLGEFLGFATVAGAGIRIAVGEFDGDPAVREFAITTGIEGVAEALVGSVSAGPGRAQVTICSVGLWIVADHPTAQFGYE